MSPRADPGVSGLEVRVGGTDVGATVGSKLVDVVADGRLRLPDRLTIRLHDPDLQLVDRGPFEVGADVVVRLGSPDADGASPVFDGQITGLEPEFTQRGAMLVVNALDRGHLLQRTSRTKTYEQMSYGDIARQVASAAGLSSGTIGSGLSLAFVQQSNETDWDFLWRLALEADYEVKVTGRQLNFRPAGRTAGSPVALTWGHDLLEFRPRVTGVQQVDEVTVRGWDPTSRQPITATSSAPAPESRLGIDRDDLVSALGDGQATVADHPVLSQRHADAIAASLAAQLASVYVEGEGIAEGTPGLTAGAQAKIEGVGERFSGTYALTGVRHVYRSRSGYRTHFSISGRALRTLLGLSAAPPADPGWAQRIVVGIVDSNQDPDQLGRVRVKYPALDNTYVGWWARLVAPGAGGARGFVTLPQPGDEVLIAFEHGNEQHPYLLGSVFNGQAKPETLAQPDGSFSLASAKQITMTATGKASLSTKETLDLASAGKATLTTKTEGDGGPADVEVSAKANLALSADQKVDVTAGPSASITAQELKIKGTTVKIDADGQVTVDAGMGQVTIGGGMVKVEAKTMLKLSGPQVMLG
ncbi:MAG TPA: VgrG-related protein [Solirubrobacteraceae bacterium]|nr:VgrG-related protein [Solirubrobacteraceae bacterium]